MLQSQSAEVKETTSLAVEGALHYLGPPPVRNVRRPAVDHKCLFNNESLLWPVHHSLHAAGYAEETWYYSRRLPERREQVAGVIRSHEPTSLNMQTWFFSIPNC
jgi:hypothetical protein